MRWKEQLLKLKPYQPGKSISEVKRQYGLTEIVKLASNENPFGSSEKVENVIAGYAGKFSMYPDGYATELRTHLADHLGVKEGQVILGNGSDEIIQMIARGLLKPGTKTVMAAPTFPQYKHNGIIEGCEITEIPLIDGAHDLDEMAAAIDERTSVVWLCSPNNPTGIYIKEEELTAFMARVPSDVLVVLDEAYYEYVTAEDYHDSLRLLKQYKNLIILRTFSKIYGLASFRVGYGIAHEETITALEPVREPFNVNTLAQAAAIAALMDQEFVDGCKKENRAGLEQFYQFCDRAGLTYYPSQGNFILIDFKKDGQEVFQFLLERGYIVRSGTALGFPTCVRITIGSKEQNQGLIQVIKEYLSVDTVLNK
ncbi:histidinol-phosphate transaminase [Mesobacillus jeotgali]|jgi:histidinol-phosphate aminotransferase|uniref:Histidinol-phosphate aminotransferase n=1 Tax=Mesobacillus jeotgali TaxID=129985 RepID=A0ABY9VC75_9BACI|nr:histidinol-phosphate transaminase [Mesobacillus jeotgali]WNF21507.1 histidinol-phosphate transaminase [Mesobacillus jeotgali]